MRKIIISEMVTLDGFFSGPNGEIDWHIVDEEFNDESNDLLNSVDTLLFGRVTYQFMADYWPSPAGLRDDPIIANKMNTLQKIVFSSTLEKAEWENSRLIRVGNAEEILKLKQLPGKDMVIFGSGNLVSMLAQQGLIDEYRIIVSPVVLGSGIPLFKDMPDKLPLKLFKTKTFRSGNVFLYYQPA